MTASCLGVIPARFPSTRLPGKPLKEIAGKTLLQRVWERASHSKFLSEVVIATDDQRIIDAAQKFGAKALMTSDKHATGSDRVGEVMEIYLRQGKRFDFVANVQGDMPFINPDVIDRTIAVLAEGGDSFGMSTVATPILAEEEFLRPSAVKVAVANDNAALYFSRAPIPFWRERSEVVITEKDPFGFKHMGLYVFRPEALRRLGALPQSLPEKREKLEQLRALCGGIRIRVAIVTQAMVHPSIEIDTPEDLERAIRACTELGL
jgi:3-deoxy-manno-octulosonate cytidylyltransferase (CMP-KDO synthetase)